MQLPRDETLQALLYDLYLDDSSVDPEVLSSQLLQILRGSANDGDCIAVDERWSGADAVLITYADTVTEQEKPVDAYTLRPEGVLDSTLPNSLAHWPTFTPTTLPSSAPFVMPIACRAA